MKELLEILKEKELRKQIRRIFLTITLAITGFVLIVVYANWQIALGIFLLMWADNIDKSTRRSVSTRKR